MDNPSDGVREEGILDVLHQLSGLEDLLILFGTEGGVGGRGVRPLLLLVDLEDGLCNILSTCLVNQGMRIETQSTLRCGYDTGSRAERWRRAAGTKAVPRRRYPGT